MTLLVVFGCSAEKTEIMGERGVQRTVTRGFDTEAEEQLSYFSLDVFRSLDFANIGIWKEIGRDYSISVEQLIEDLKRVKRRPSDVGLTFKDVLLEAQKWQPTEPKAPVPLFAFADTELIPPQEKERNLSASKGKIHLDKCAVDFIAGAGAQVKSTMPSASVCEAIGVNHGRYRNLITKISHDASLVLGSFGKPKAVFLKDVLENSGLSSKFAEGKRYVWVDFYFTLPRLGKLEDEGFHYKNVEFSIKTFHEGLVSHVLIPDRVYRVEDVQKKYVIGLDASYKEAMKVGGEYGIEVRYERLAPVILSFGLRESSFKWFLQGYKDEPLWPGSKALTAILEVPSNVREIGGVMSLSGTFTNNAWFRTTIQPIGTIQQCFAFDLYRNLRFIECVASY